MAKKMLSDEKLSALLSKAISESEHLTDGKLSKERSTVGQYYRGELPLPMHKGDSKYVSRDVFDTVDSMRATVLEAFMAHSNIVYFRPEKGDTVDDAKQATEYCRHVFFKENDGEQNLYDTVTDGLMNRYAVSKVYYESNDEEDEYEFEDFTKEELALAVEPHKSWEFNEALVTDEGLYTGSYIVKRNDKRICVETLQPEDFLISSNAASIKDAKWCIHRTDKTRSDLIKSYGKDKIDDLTFTARSDYIFDYEKQDRFNAIGDITGSGDSTDESTESIMVHEVYIYLDMDSSGKSQLWRIVYAGGNILDKERISRYPFATFVPLPIPHTFYGENFANAVVPTQNARTVLIRQIINHSTITNNPRLQVLNGTVMNPNELLDNRLGGIVNVRRMDGLAPIPQAQLNPFVFNLIGMIDEDKEETTGISKLSQGMNKDAISSQNSQGMVEQLMGASQQRTKIISRRFGSYLKDLWFLIYHTAVDYIDEAEFMSVTGNYVAVNPTDWKERTVASVELSLGYAEQEKEASKWAEIDSYFTQDPELKSLYSLDRRYEVISRGLEKRGIEDIQSILMPPQELPPPKPDPMQELAMAQAQAQLEYTKAQSQAMSSKAQTDQMNAKTAFMKAQTEAGFKKEEIALAMQSLANDIMVDKAELLLASKASEQKAVYNPS